MSKQATAKPKEIIEEINKLRENPSLYAKKVEEYSTYFNDKIFKLPNLNIKIQTQEGAAPYIETVEYLKTKEKINTLIPSKALCEIAQEIADNLVDSETGEIDEELHEQIIDKHGSFSGKFTRAMDFGGFTSEQVVINFLVCDGDVDRTQREPLLGEGLKKIGVAFGKHNIHPGTRCCRPASWPVVSARSGQPLPHSRWQDLGGCGQTRSESYYLR